MNANDETLGAGSPKMEDQVLYVTPAVFYDRRLSDVKIRSRRETHLTAREKAKKDHEHRCGRAEPKGHAGCMARGPDHSFQTGTLRDLQPLSDFGGSRCRPRLVDRKSVRSGKSGDS